jgi:hypothetical protein
MRQASVSNFHILRPTRTWMALASTVVALLSATAAIPSSFSAFERASAAGPSVAKNPGCTSVMTFVTEVWPSVGNGGSGYVNPGPVQLINCHPAFDRAVPIERARYSGSGSPIGPIPASKAIPANDLTLSAMRLVCSGDSNRGALNFANSRVASAARFSARFVSFSFAEIRSADCCLSTSQWCSLTFANRIITNVESTPDKRLPSNTTLATSDQNVAVDSNISENGHIRFPDWFFLDGIVVIAMTPNFKKPPASCPKSSRRSSGSGNWCWRRGRRGTARRRRRAGRRSRALGPGCR